jgi:PBP1b-binding outer membrane lipoprotein LpoB
MRSIRYVAATLFALALMSCSQNGGQPTMSVQDVQDQIKAACNFVPTIESITAVAAAVTSAIDPAAGATATILVSVGNNIVAEVCKAVQTQVVSTAGDSKTGAPRQLTVTVEGKPVTGTWTPGSKT